MIINKYIQIKSQYLHSKKSNISFEYEFNTRKTQIWSILANKIESFPIIQYYENKINF